MQFEFDCSDQSSQDSNRQHEDSRSVKADFDALNDRQNIEQDADEEVINFFEPARHDNHDVNLFQAEEEEEKKDERLEVIESQHEQQIREEEVQQL